MAQPLVIFGSAEIAELAYFYFKNDSDFEVVAFTVDDEYVTSDNYLGLPLIPFSEVREKFPPSTHKMHVALSYAKLNRLRQDKYEHAKSVGYELASYVCSKSVAWEDLSIGDNCFILENQTIQPSVKIGNNVVLWSGNHIGHGSEISDHTYISSHVVISGNCKIGQRCFFGVNSTIKDFTEIGDECFIGMAAAVTNNMQKGSVALGATAEIFSEDDRRARALKKMYFKI